MKSEYLEKTGAAARRMAESGLLPDRDVVRFVDAAAVAWDFPAKR